MKFFKENIVGCGFLAASALLFSFATFGRDALPPSQDSMLYPRIVLALMFVCSFLTLAGSALGYVKTALPELRVRTGLTCVAAVGAYVVAMLQAGFIPATLVFLGVFPLILGYRRIIPVVFVLVGGTFGVWWVFTRLLNIFLPETAVLF